MLNENQSHWLNVIRISGGMFVTKRADGDNYYTTFCGEQVPKSIAELFIYDGLVCGEDDGLLSGESQGYRVVESAL